MIVGAVFAVAIAHAPQALPAPWQPWKYVRSIAIAGRAGTLTIAIPPTLYANAKSSLDDVRIIDGGGNPVPFALATPIPETTQAWTDAVLTDEGFVAGKYSQAVADLGTRRAAHGILDITPERETFATTVDVDASDDGMTWRLIRSGAPIYDYRSDGLATNTRVTFPTSTARYLRVRVLDGKRPFGIAGIRVSSPGSVAPESTRYELATSVAHVGKATVLTIGGIDQTPIDRFRIDSRTARFVRSVDVQTADGAGGWETLRTANISRTAPGRDELSIDIAETQASRWRLVIQDGDDAPLAGLRVTAYGAPRRIYFDTDGGSRRLVYGNPRADAPSFDYAQTHELQALKRALPVALGPALLNPGFESGVPWSEQHPWLLWLALGIAVIGVGTIAVRTMSKPAG
jgi:hypothetical protein